MQIKISDILLNYQILGKKNRPVVLVLHGWGRSLQEWLPLARFLSNNKKVILVDLPGFGNSSMPVNGFDTFNTADYLKAFLKKIKVNQEITIVAHSFGAKVAIILGSQEELKIKKLVLVAPPGLPASFRSKLLGKSSKIFKNSLGLILPSKITKQIVNLLASSDFKQAGGLKQSLTRVVQQPVVGKLQKLKQPIVFVWGDQDPILPVKQVKVFKKAAPLAKVRIAWETGHDPHLENPGLTKEIITEEI